jgi:tetratricopeptide (TPR) repeat protein
MPHGRRLETTSRPYTPDDADALRCALARVVASETFRNAPRLVSFLSYVVEKTIAGEGAALKGYTIATQALGRGEDFDPQADPIVRVEAGRLRRALQTYYEGEGAADPLRIVVPVGSYVPILATAPSCAGGDAPAGPEPQAPAEASAMAARAGWSGWRAVARMAAVALVALGIGWFAGTWFMAAEDEDTAVAQSAREDGRSVLVIPPMRNVGEAPETFRPSLLRGTVAEALARFDGFIVVDRDREEPPPGYPHYELQMRAIRGGNGVHVNVRLTQRPTGELVWTHEADLAQGDGFAAAQRELGRWIAVTVGQPFGVLFSDMRARVVEGSEGHCLILAHDSRFSVSEKEHAQVRDCLEAVVAARPTYHLGYALLTQFYVMEHRSGFNQRFAPLDRALRAAQKALELAPQSARAHYAMMTALFARGDIEASLRAGHRAVELNPYNTDIAAELGARYVQVARYAEGVPLLEAAIAANPGRPPWYDFYRFLAAYMTEDLPTARSIAATFVGSRHFYGPFARSLIAFRDGEPERARQLLHEVRATMPQFAGQPQASLERAGFCPTITERLVSDLRQFASIEPSPRFSTTAQ